MNVMVSARVPVELRDQVSDQLQRIGATPTELINRAYEFVLANKALPEGRQGMAPGRRVLAAAQLEELRQSIERTTLPLLSGLDDGISYDSMLEEALRDEHEALA